MTMRVHRFPGGAGRLFAVLLCLLAPGVASCFAYNVEDYEEPAGSSVSLLINPADSIYGIAFENSTWLRGTPLLGQLFLPFYYHDEAETFFGGLGMVFRLMPHTRVAPYVGGGASYNLSTESNTNDLSASFWGGHADAGLRIWSADRVSCVDLYGRQTWNLENSEMSFWLIGIGYGQSW